MYIFEKKNAALSQFYLIGFNSVLSSTEILDIIFPIENLHIII